MIHAVRLGEDITARINLSIVDHQFAMKQVKLGGSARTAVPLLSRDLGRSTPYPVIPWAQPRISFIATPMSSNAFSPLPTNVEPCMVAHARGFNEASSLICDSVCRV